ncbi:hypothetical protein SEVIR_2G454000v4 [Setaria viridis]|uniref:Protein SCAR n=2 Tax=Setaria viridis TaxID=4556 RepID=A0A4U6W785_SETVI|nr:uncharacterized protein LOC117844647 [Setaria viridis]TKW36659.1 hypothetical protein SEVIR_2G454000v2 [Setaria viridis]
MAALPLGPSSEQEPPEGEAVLEGLAMAGLVAVLRQLGDLAELAAEVLDGLQDQVMAVSARGRRLAMRAKRLQADLTPSIHNKPNHRLDWHPRLNLNHHQQHGVGEAPPRSIVDHIKRCRGPPNLSALDRFDAHGEGACLKRYTDPSFFRTCHSDDCRSQTDASEKQSLGFLSMLRQLTHRQTPGSLINLPKYYESSAEKEMDKAKENRPGQSKDSPTSNCCSDYVGNCSDELERTSSFEAWLSPGARFSTHEYETADGTVQETSCNKGVSIEDTNVDTPPLVPIPPMQWLSVKVHTGPITYRNSFGRNRVNRAGGKILKTTELSEPAIHSYEAWSEAEGTNQQQVFKHKGPEISSCRGNTVSDSEANKPSQADSASGQGDEDSLHHENVLFSAVEQLAGMSPPWVPRPKHPLPEVASQDRITLRNGPSPIHRSRSILDSRTALLHQIKDKDK